MYKKQLQLEELYDKHQQFPRLMELFKKANIVSGTGSEEILVLLVHVAIQKRIPIAAALGILGAKHPYEDAAIIIEFCVQNNLVGLHKDMLTANYEPDSKTQEQMKLYMFPPPMVVQPQEIEHNYQSGYLNCEYSVMTKKSHTKEDVCLDVINILNSFEYTLNLNVLESSSQYDSLKDYKTGESQEDYAKRYKQWKRFDTVTRELISNHYQDVDSIWFTHQYDKRGRVYCRGYNISYQGSEWSKALVHMKPEVLK